MRAIESFHYRLAHPGYSVFPGAHPGQTVGGGQLFKRHEPLLASPDPRRIDLRASVLDPFQHYRVRVFQQHSKLAVFVIADLSASMRASLHWLADFVLSAAQSALQCGDSFGFIGCGPALDRRWWLPAGQAMQPVRALTERLREFQPHGSAGGLVSAATRLPARRSLVFWVSDCHFDAASLPNILRPLTPHAVVPLVAWDEAEYRSLPDWGLVRFQDAENRRARTLLMRPGLKRRIEQGFEDRRQHLRRSFRAFGMEPLFVGGSYRAEAMDRYFLQHVL